MQQIEETPVPDLQAILLIEHAKAVRHVVERDVEAVGLLLEAGCERRFLARHGQRLNDDFADAERDVHHAVHEQQTDEAEDFVYPVGVEEKRNHHRQHDGGELAERDERTAGVTSRNGGRIAGGSGDDRHLQRGLLRLHQRQPAQNAEQRREAPGAGFVHALPRLRFRCLISSLVPAVKDRRDDPQHADREDRDRIGHDRVIADAQRDDHADDRAIDRADRQRGDRGEQRLDQGRADFRRQLRISPAYFDQFLKKHRPRAPSGTPAILAATIQQTG